MDLEIQKLIMMMIQVCDKTTKSIRHILSFFLYISLYPVTKKTW